MASKSLSDAAVRAPFAGMISQRFVSVGEYVQPATKVVNLVELDPLRLQLTVSEIDVAHVQLGQSVDFSVEAYPGKAFSGTVKFIDPTVRTSTRDLVVEAVVPNAERLLKPGMFATAHLVLPDEKVPAVPKGALREEGTITRLFAVVEGHVEERIVQRGPERDGFVVILDGVRVGDRVITAPDDQVKDGVPVN